jgi:hypothetical protein
MARRLPRLTRSKGTKLRRAYVWIGHQVEPSPGCDFLPADFSDLDFLAILSAYVGKNAESKETKKVTTSSLHPHPTGILFFTKKPGIVTSKTP